MRLMGLNPGVIAIAVFCVTSQAYSPPPNVNVERSWNSVTIGGLGDTEAGVCPWDCSGGGDGTVGISDFLLLLAQWGGPGTCDLDGGGVGITDFLELLANWGPCP